MILTNHFAFAKTIARYCCSNLRCGSGPSNGMKLYRSILPRPSRKPERRGQFMNEGLEFTMIDQRYLAADVCSSFQQVGPSQMNIHIQVPRTIATQIRLNA